MLWKSFDIVEHQSLSLNCVYLLSFFVQVGRDMAELAWRIIKSDDQLLEGLFQDTHNYPDGLQDTLRQAIPEAKQSSQPLCLLFGGETTVEVKGSGNGIQTATTALP